MNAEKEMLIVVNAVVQSVRLRLGEEWFDLASAFIHLCGPEYGTELADDALLKIVLGLSEGRTFQQLEGVLQLPFRLKGQRLSNAEGFISSIQQKCAIEISVWKAAAHWRRFQDKESKSIVLDLYPKLLRVHSRILDYSERPELQQGARMCLASARAHLDYGSLAAQAIQEKRESIEWFYAIILTIFDKMSEEKPDSKICVEICCEEELGTEPPSWLKALVEMITKSCKKEALAFAALKCAVVSHCKPERVLEIVQERLGN